MPRCLMRPAALLVFAALVCMPMTAKADPIPANVTPDKVKAALTALAQLTQDAMQKTGVPGIAIAVVYQDHVVYLKGFGVREAGKNDLVDADTVFQLASVSKPLGSTVIAGLVHDGVVQWDDRIIDHDPDFAMDDPYVTRHVTIRDMYAHRSGLPEHAGDLLEDMGYDRAAILHQLRFVPTAAHFRAQYAYTNFGLTAGAVAAARAARKSWEDVSNDRLYTPLGMHATSSRFDDFIKNPYHAAGHRLLDGKWVAQEQRQPDAQSPAGGASSSARDMAQWMRLHLAQGQFDGKQLLSAEALAETYRPHMVSDPKRRPATERYSFYGLGWGVSYDELGRVRLSHSGAFALGAATTVSLLPSEQLGIVVLSNAAPIGVPEALAQSFLDLATYGKVQRDWVELYKQGFAALATAGRSPTEYTKPPVPSVLPALSNDAYVGVYHNDFFGALVIVARNGRLVMQQGPKKTPFALTHYNRDVFYYATVGENAVGLSGVTFTMGADGKGLRVVIENLHTYGDGTFKRLGAGTGKKDG